MPLMLGVGVSPSGLAILSNASSRTPLPPPGYVFLTDRSGSYLVDERGSLLIERL
jgi:hypothetical protein